MSVGNVSSGSCCCGVLPSSSATLGTRGSEGTSKRPGISSVWEKQASHDCWCSVFLLIAEMELGWGIPSAASYQESPGKGVLPGK